MTDIMTSQNIDISSWDILHVDIKMETWNLVCSFVHQFREQPILFSVFPNAFRIPDLKMPEIWVQDMTGYEPSLDLI
jgi:hypothetical protein